MLELKCAIDHSKKKRVWLFGDLVRYFHQAFCATRNRANTWRWMVHCHKGYRFEICEIFFCIIRYCHTHTCTHTHAHTHTHTHTCTHTHTHAHTHKHTHTHTHTGFHREDHTVDEPTNIPGLEKNEDWVWLLCGSTVGGSRDVGCVGCVSLLTLYWRTLYHLIFWKFLCGVPSMFDNSGTLWTGSNPYTLQENVWKWIHSVQRELMAV